MHQRRRPSAFALINSEAIGPMSTVAPKVALPRTNVAGAALPVAGLGLPVHAACAAFLLIFPTYPWASASGSTSPTRGSAAPAPGSASELPAPVGGHRGWLSVFNTIRYTTVASAGSSRSASGWLPSSTSTCPSRPLPRHLLPPRVRSDRAVGHRLLVDLRQPVLDHLPGPRADPASSTAPINFLGDQTNARAFRDPRQRMARHPVRGDHAPGGPADHLAVPARGRDARRRHGWQRFCYITLPMLSPLIAVVMTFSVLFTFTRFPAHLRADPRRPLNATHLMATLSFQRAIPGGQLGRAAIAVAMIPFLLAAILFSYSACSAAAGSRVRRRLNHERTRPRPSPPTLAPAHPSPTRASERAISTDCLDGSWCSICRSRSSSSCCCSRSTG